MRLAENEPTDARSFMRIMGEFPGTENWFYVDQRDAAFIQSGRYPRHARGSNVDLPFWGDGTADWQGFDPGAYTFRTIAGSRRPQAINPGPKKGHGLIVSWNNKESPTWRKGPAEWSDGPVHHAKLLERNLLGQLRRSGKVDLTGLTRAANLAATADLRGQEDYPWMRRVIGRAPAEDETLLGLLDEWSRTGSHRLDADGDNVYDQSAAVALMDAWWPRFVRAQFEPDPRQGALRHGRGPRARPRRLRLGLGDPRPEGPAQRAGPPRARALLAHLLRRAGPGQARRKVRRRARAPLPRRGCSTPCGGGGRGAAKQGADPSAWKVLATCPEDRPAVMRPERATTAGAVGDAALPVAEPRHLPPGRRGARPPLMQGRRAIPMICAALLAVPADGAAHAPELHPALLSRESPAAAAPDLVRPSHCPSSADPATFTSKRRLSTTSTSS